MKKAVQKMCAAFIAAFVFALCLFAKPNTAQAAGGGWLYLNPGDNTWYYYVDGVVDTSYTGLAQNDFGWWYVSNGTIDWNYTGMAANEFGWWYVSGGTIDWNYTGMAANDFGWWYITNGVLDWNYTGMAANDFGWWYMTNGALDWNYTGMAANDFGWWYITNGALDWNYTGMAANDFGWWYMTNGALNWNYTGMAANDFGWWYITNGALDLSFHGIGSNAYGYWYYNNGVIDFNFNGEFTFNGMTYDVTGGFAVPREDIFRVGNAATGELTGGVYMIRSNSNPNYALTVEESATAEGGYNLVMSKITGANSQKFLVVKDEASSTYCFMSLAYIDANGDDASHKWLINSYNHGWGTNAFTDNIQVTSDSVNGTKNWTVTETSAGVYTIAIARTDYTFYMTSEDNSNVGTALWSNAGTQTFNFVSPYTQILADGAYTIAASDNTAAMLSAKDASVKDDTPITLADASEGSEQLFYINCIDSSKGLYKIKNANSQRFVYTKGSISIGTAVMQAQGTDNIDQTWYIQKNTNGTYSFISANSYQYLTLNGAAASETSLQQAIGHDTSAQRFVLTPKSFGQESLTTGIYSFGNNNYRISSLGNGVYTVYSLTQNGFCAANGNGSMYFAASSDAAEAKWLVTKTSDGYVFQSAAHQTYMTSDAGLSSNAENISISDLNASVTDYSVKYDLSALNALDSLNGIQVISRLHTLGLSRSDLMNPEANMTSLNTNIQSALSGLPTQTVQYTGTDVDDLNQFLQNNTGKIVQLTQDIQVYKNTNGSFGIIMVPSDTILDGNGHRLVMKAGYTEAPDVGVVLYVYKDGVIPSTNCGVKNLSTDIPYVNSINVFSADNILIENNTLNNATKSGIMISDEYGSTVNGIIRGNTINNVGDDAIAVYGNHSNLLIDSNRISGAKGFAGIAISCLQNGQQIRVDNETTGPHDIIVTGNVVSGCSGEALYCIGSYKTYITYNTLRDSILEGVCLDSGCIGNYFAHNEVVNNGIAGGLPGVSIDNGIYNIVDSNNVYNNSCSGIKLVRTGLGNIIVNNICTDNAYNQMGAKSSGIDIEPLAVETENLGYIDGLGSNWNVVLNNTVTGSHDFGVFIADDDTANNGGSSCENVIMYNKFSSAYTFGAADFSSMSSTVKNNITLN